MRTSIKSPKILVFFRLCGYLDLLKQVIEIGKKENIQYIVSLGDCFGYHDNINECIDLGKKCVLLKGGWETCLASEKDVFITNIRLSKLVFETSKSQLNEESKKLLKNLKKSIQINDIHFDAFPCVMVPNKLNFGIPLLGSFLPTVSTVNQELIEAEINKEYKIANYMNQNIFPGCLYNTSPPDGIGYYCIVEGDSFSFRKIEYSLANSSFYKLKKIEKPHLFK
jgi:hypothetical protein